MVKYKLTYTDVLNNEYICTIANDAYEGAIIPVQGYAVLDYPQIENIHQVIRGSGLKLTLEANSELTLQDLYEEGEKTQEVLLYRNNEIIFRGFVDPAGLFEDLVNDKWEVTIDCLDGLALLENLSYVDEDGFPYEGRLSDIQTIINCLRRTGLRTQEVLNDVLVVSSLNTRYNGLSSDLCPLKNVYSNQDRFYKDDGETIMSCREVLESTLRKYGGCIMQNKGEWHIFSFYELLAPDRRFYTYLGVFQQGVSITNYPSQEITSYSGDDLIHWVGGNQSKEIKPGVGALKVNYKYGFVKSLLDNPNLINNGSNIPDWTILSEGDVTLQEDGAGVDLFATSVATELLESDSYDIANEDILTVEIRYRFYFGEFNTTLIYRLNFKMKIIISDGSNTQYLQDNGTWGNSDNTFEFFSQSNRGGNYTQVINLEPAPFQGEIKALIIRAKGERFSSTTGIEPFDFDYSLRQVKIFPATDENIQGETHTQQIAGKNTRIEDVVEVSVGDNPSDIYLGSIYKSDSESNTTLWNTIYTPNDIVNPQSILEILSEQLALYRRDPSYVIKGDVLGYFNPLQIFSLDLVQDKLFTIKSYSFNTKTAVNTCEFLEIKRGSTFGLTYEYAIDYGNVVEPTIVG